MPGPRVLPGARAHFVPPFGVFSFGRLRLFSKTPESLARADTQ
jgi:hypothetical protein